VLVRELLYRPFGSRKRLASYVGMTPMPYLSGTMDHDRSIGWTGNPRARTTMVQLAWLWLRYQLENALASWFRARAGSAAGTHPAARYCCDGKKAADSAVVLFRLPNFDPSSMLFRPRLRGIRNFVAPHIC
jgi:transposase